MNGTAPREGLLGTKTAPPVAVGAPSGGGGLVQTLLAVAVVAILLKWALPKLARRLGAPLNAPPGSGLRIEESASFPGGHLHVVRARGKTLLVGTTSGSVATLADLTEPASPRDDLPLFREMVEAAAPYSPAPYSPDPAPDRDRAADLARRLEHLSTLK